MRVVRCCDRPLQIPGWAGTITGAIRRRNGANSRKAACNPYRPTLARRTHHQRVPLASTPTDTDYTMHAQSISVALPFLRTQFLRTVIYIVFLISYLHLVRQLYVDYTSGGHTFKQGDWLINSQNGTIRRGITGDLFLWLSDFTQIDPLTLVIISQIMLVTLLFYLMLRIIHLVNDFLLLVLVFSPAMFVFIWPVDHHGAVRKELLVFVAIGMFALGIIQHNYSKVVLSLAFFIFTVASHEAMLLCLPVLVFMFLLADPAIREAYSIGIALILTTIISVLVFLIAIGQPDVSDSMLVCQPLIERGLQFHMCEGAIKWLEYDLRYAFNAVATQASFANFSHLLMSQLLPLLPFFYLIYLANNKLMATLITIMPVLLISPLYFIAIDWGRWISISTYCSFMIFAIAISAKKIRCAKLANANYILAVVIICVTFAPTHLAKIYWGGIVRQTANTIYGFLV